MDPRTRNVFAGILVIVIGLTATAAILLGQTRMPTPPPEAEAVEGIIVSVDSAGLTDVKGFDLRVMDGTVMAFSLDRLENGAAFPPGHLVEHQASALPVQVWFREDGGVLYAILLEDAQPSS
jgi:hypothetical protein